MGESRCAGAGLIGPYQTTSVNEVTPLAGDCARDRAAGLRGLSLVAAPSAPAGETDDVSRRAGLERA